MPIEIKQKQLQDARCLLKQSRNNVVNLLSVNAVHGRHDADVACSGCSALHRQNY